MKNETRETAPGRTLAALAGARTATTQEPTAPAPGSTFRGVITETLKRVVEVNESEIKEPTMDEAVQAVSDWWHNGQIVLEAEDFDGVDFSAAEGGEVGD